jgi:diguanylate cyclase (GGDEF)-like protein
MRCASARVALLRHCAHNARFWPAVAGHSFDRRTTSVTMNRLHISGLLRGIAPYLALWLVCSALVGGAVVSTVVADRDRDRNDAQKDAANLTRLMQAQALRTLDTIDRTLSLVRAVQERQLAGSSPRSLFQTLRLGDDVQYRVTVFDRDGRFVTSTDAEGRLATIPVADRDYFRAARNAGAEALIVAQPIMGRLTGHTLVPVVKRVTSPSGEFDGIVMSAFDPTRLIDVYGAINLGGGEFVGVAQREGRIIASSMPAEDGRQPGPAALPAAHNPDDPSIAWTVLDGATYLVATRPVPDTELRVFVARPEIDILAGNLRFANAVALLGGLSLLALALPIGYTARRSLRVLREHEALEARARIDPLTQTNNRAALVDRLQLCLDRVARDDEAFALAFIDIDNFKAVNDSRGHAEGDRALSRIAGILQSSVRKTDVVARMGGDEFAVLLPAATAAATRGVFDQVIEMLRVLAQREAWPISFSVGVVAFLTSPENASEAIAIADRVMYTVKQTTKDGVCFASLDHDGLQVETSAASVRAERWQEASSSGHVA